MRAATKNCQKVLVSGPMLPKEQRPTVEAHHGAEEAPEIHHGLRFRGRKFGIKTVPVRCASALSFKN